MLRIRPLHPTDGDMLDGLMDGLSDRSRYQRFHGPKPRLTASDRRRLLAVDGVTHLALLALGPDGEPLGIARAVRWPGDPATADLAAEVVDARQRQGLGTLLMQRLAREAARAGIERFSATVLTQTGLDRSLRRRGWRLRERDGTTVTLDVDVWAVARATEPAAPGAVAAAA